MNIGKKISKLRKKMDMSQQELANKLNVSNKTISKWECGYSIPDIETLKLLAQIFDISLNQLVNDGSAANILGSCEKTETVKKYQSKYKKMNIILGFSLACIIIVLIAILSVYLIQINEKNIQTLPKIESSNIFSIDEENFTISCSVENSKENFSFNETFEVADNCSWELYYDITGNKEINSKTVNLVIGDNTYYVLIKNNIGNKKMYKAVVRRRPMYLVNFDTLGGTNVQSQSIEENSVAIKPEQNPIKTGYTFINWGYDFTKPIISSITIVANYRANTYKITYHSNQQINDTLEQECVYDKYFLTKSSNVFSKNGYDLVGWSFEENQNEILIACNSNGLYSWAKDIDLYAIWQVKSYHIYYVLNGAHNLNNIFNYTIESKDILFQNAYKKGYSFVGWYTDDSFQNKIEKITSGSYGDIYLYPKFEMKSEDTSNPSNTISVNLENYQSEVEEYSEVIIPSGKFIYKDAFGNDQTHLIGTSNTEEITTNIDVYFKKSDTFVPITNGTFHVTHSGNYVITYYVNYNGQEYYFELNVYSIAKMIIEEPSLDIDLENLHLHVGEKYDLPKPVISVSENSLYGYWGISDDGLNTANFYSCNVVNSTTGSVCDIDNGYFTAYATGVYTLQFNVAILGYSKDIKHFSNTEAEGKLFIDEGYLKYKINGIVYFVYISKDFSLNCNTDLSGFGEKLPLEETEELNGIVELYLLKSAIYRFIVE